MYQCFHAASRWIPRKRYFRVPSRKSLYLISSRYYWIKAFFNLLKTAPRLARRSTSCWWQSRSSRDSVYENQARKQKFVIGTWHFFLIFQKRLMSNCADRIRLNGFDSLVQLWITCAPRWTGQLKQVRQNWRFKWFANWIGSGSFVQITTRDDSGLNAFWNCQTHLCITRHMPKHFTILHIISGFNLDI